MPTVKLSPLFNGQTVKSTGVPASGHKINTYTAGSSSKLATYTTVDGDVAQANPIVLNSNGLPDNEIWVQAGLAYKYVWTDENDVVIDTFDNISGINDTTTSVSQWASSGVTPTYVSATSFTMSGDQTSEFHVGRRLQFTTTAGTDYGTITDTTYTTLTTVTVRMDDLSTLDVGLSVVNLSIIRADHSALPTTIINEKHGADIASASTINLTAATGNLVDVTGTTTISTITLAEGAARTVRFTGALTLTNGASLVLPGGANITTAAGDFAIFRGYSGGVVRCAGYLSASGQPVATVSIAKGGTGATGAGAAAAALGTVGAGQVMTNVLASRAIDTTYTNSTGRTIYVQGYCTNGTGGRMEIFVNDISICRYTAASAAPDMPFAFMVPNGETYKVSTLSGSFTLTAWAELR